MIKPEELSKDIPVTLLYKWLSKQAKGSLTDSIAALAYLSNTASDILREKAVAAVAIHNNRTSLWDLHGILNTCMIMNSVPASVDYVASVDPSFIAYAVWELTEDDPELVVGPVAMKALESAVDGAGYVYPPDELAVMEDYFLVKYPRAVIVKNIYTKCRKAESVEGSLALLEEETSSMQESKRLFYGYHVSRLLAADNYVGKMKKVYNDWTERFNKEGVL